MKKKSIAQIISYLGLILLGLYALYGAAVSLWLSVGPPVHNPQKYEYAFYIYLAVFIVCLLIICIKSIKFFLKKRRKY